MTSGSGRGATTCPVRIGSGMIVDAGPVVGGSVAGCAGVIGMCSDAPTAARLLELARRNRPARRIAQAAAALAQADVAAPAELAP